MADLVIVIDPEVALQKGLLSHSVHLHSHVTPSPIKPSLHVQLNDPIVFVQ